MGPAASTIDHRRRRASKHSGLHGAAALAWSRIPDDHNPKPTSGERNGSGANPGVQIADELSVGPAIGSAALSIDPFPIADSRRTTIP